MKRLGILRRVRDGRQRLHVDRFEVAHLIAGGFIGTTSVGYRGCLVLHLTELGHEELRWMEAELREELRS